MRMALIGLAALLLQGTQDAPGRAPLMLEIAARGYLAGGRAGSLAGDSAVDSLESYVWVDQTLCSMGAGNAAPQNTPWAGWRFTGNVVSRTSDELVVNVEWQRLWEAGRRTSGGNQNRSIRIRAGERVELDRVEPGNAGRCNMVEARLEASVMARAPYLMGVAAGVAGGAAGGVPGGVAVAGGRGGRGAGIGRGSTSTSVSGGTAGTTATMGRGGRGAAVAGGVAGGDPTTASAGAAVGVASGATTTATGRGRGGAMSGSGTATTGTVSGSGSGRGGRGSAGGTVQGSGMQASAGTAVQGGARGGRGTVLAEMFARHEAEIWLVHKTPDGKEIVQQQTIRFGGSSVPFAFPPVEVGPSSNPITLDISGAIQTLSSTGQRYGLTTGYAAAGRGVAGRGSATASSATPSASGSTTPLFGLSISRRARRANPFIDTRGSTDVSIRTDKPDDVLSFELPPFQKPTEDLLKGHSFQLRVRISPIK